MHETFTIMENVKEYLNQEQLKQFEEAMKKMSELSVSMKEKIFMCMDFMEQKGMLDSYMQIYQKKFGDEAAELNIQYQNWKNTPMPAVQEKNAMEKDGTEMEKEMEKEPEEQKEQQELEKESHKKQYTSKKILKI